MAILNTSEFAKALGIKPETLRQHIRRGKVHRMEDGNIDTEFIYNKKYIDDVTGGNGLNSGVTILGRKPKAAIIKEKESKTDIVNEIVYREPKTEPKREVEKKVTRNSKELKMKFEFEMRKAKAEAEKTERDSELKRIQIEKLAGKLLPIELVEKIFVINIQNIYKNIDSEMENIASVFVDRLGGNREDLAVIITDVRKILKGSIERSKNDSTREMEASVDNYSEIRSRGERK